MGSGLSGVETPLRSAFLGGGWALPAEPGLCGWRHTRTSPFFPQSSPLTALALFLMRWACCGFCGSCPNKATRCVPADLPDTPPGDGFTAPPVHNRSCCRQLCSQTKDEAAAPLRHPPSPCFGELCCPSERRGLLGVWWEELFRFGKPNGCNAQSWNRISPLGACQWVLDPEPGRDAAALGGVKAEPLSS